MRLIKELRTAQKLSQSELARKLEVTPGTIGHLENGRMKISDKLVVKVKEVFGVEVDVKADVKAAESKVETTVKKSAAKAKEAKLTIIVQSPYGGNITATEIAKKIPACVDTVFVRVDQNKLW